MKTLLQKILKSLSKKILDKYNPEIIGITGSVGKTGAKNAIATILSNNFCVRKTLGNYNNEVGVPLTIIGAKSAGKNIFAWFVVFLQAIKLILMRDKNYPAILVLEMAVDKPGDMDYLLDIVSPTSGVLTRIGPVHLEFFGSLEKILEEKSKLIKSLPQKGFVVLNYDYKDVAGLCESTKARCITYGLEEGADVRARNVLLGRGQISFTLDYKKESTPVVIGAVGKAQVYATLAGIACGLAKQMKIAEIKEALGNWESDNGRGNIVKGIKNTTIIDETYNSSPQAVEMALENLHELSSIPSLLSKGGLRGVRKIAVLGDMLELGDISSDAHFEVGKKVRELEINYLFVIGQFAKDILKGAKEGGMHDDKMFEFKNNKELTIALKDILEDGDMILIKGSRGMKLEEVVDQLRITN